MTVAVFAPIMGFSACFGGPMLNILLGIGLSGTYVLSHSPPPPSGTSLLSLSLSSAPYIELHFGSTLFTSCVGLLSILFTTLIVVPVRGYKLERWWGITLIVGYAVIMSINLWVELKGVFA
jgi:solute carrier family 24 (sodium/potassium/calcium exchanger), member 6